jgi:5-methylcytosine-specific restriction enzyme A
VTTRRRKDSLRPPKGHDGRPRCRWCRGEVAPPRRTFCGPACVHEWKLRRDPSYVRKCVLKRDDGKCARCGEDTILGWHSLKILERLNPPMYLETLARMKIKPGRKSLWEADHILPVKDGGGECGLDGYQTLCLECHRDKTAKGRKKGP